MPTSYQARRTEPECECKLSCHERERCRCFRDRSPAWCFCEDTKPPVTAGERRKKSRRAR